MRHLFIINPAAYEIKGRLNETIRGVKDFFSENAHLPYDIHISRWERDATGFIHRYAHDTDEFLRVHVMGGTGSLFEAVNAVIGLPNLQLAAYPYGRSNEFLRYFGSEKMHLFNSIRSQVFSNVMALDTIRCGHNFSIVSGMVGLEALTDRDSNNFKFKNPRIPHDLSYILPAVKRIISPDALYRHYKIDIDGQKLDGEYVSILVANAPCYGKNMNPAVDAHPNDGILDIYMIQAMSKPLTIMTMFPYLSGNYHKHPDRILHYRGKRITISTDDVICLSLDGEIFYENEVIFEVIPYSIDFVCPYGIDPEKIPHVFKSGNAQ
jgi:diacylglycerol kinase family enzyme